jgi:uncharacterized protein
LTAVRIIVFAKLPQPGQVKTRLIPALGEQVAAQLAEKMLHATVAKALEADCGQVELCVSPSVTEFTGAVDALPAALIWSQQGPGDLGRRLAKAAERALAVNSACLLIGTDCPALDANLIRRAADSLSGADCCMVPATDGGYVLLGLRRFSPALFADIPWSTCAVAEMTRERVRALGWSLAEFPSVADIDEPADLSKLPAEWLTELNIEI